MKRLSSNNHNFYKIIDEICTDYLYCYQKIRWNVEIISKDNNANGYIVQLVNIKYSINNNCIIKKYFEAWKVENGKCISFDDKIYDDIFIMGESIYDSFDELQLSIGNFGQSSFEGLVFWVDKKEKLYNRISLWKCGKIKEANQLQSIKYSKKLEEKLKKNGFFKREVFVHKWDMTKEEQIYKACYKFIYNNCKGLNERLVKSRIDYYINQLFPTKYSQIKKKLKEALKKELKIS